MALIDINFIKKNNLLTPFFIYNLDIIKRQFIKLKSAIPDNIEVFYSLKTNPNMDVLKLIRNLGLGAEITSTGEFVKARKAKFPCSKIIFTGPGKTDKEIRDSIMAGIRLIIVESLTEAQRIDKLAGSLGRMQDILLRVNTHFRISEHCSMRSLTGASSKFGIDEESLPQTVESVIQFKNIRLRGFHSYPASGVLDYKLLLNHIENIFTIVKIFSNKITYQPIIVDIGAGLGVNYSGNKEKHLKLSRYGKGLARLIKKYNIKNVDIILEVGRFLVAESADYVTKVLDVKISRGVKFIVVDGGIHHLSRACLLENGHPVELLARKNMLLKERVNIVGRLSYPSDFITKKTLVSFCEPGDFLIIKNVGAYGLTAGMNNFSSLPLPTELIFKGKNNF